MTIELLNLKRHTLILQPTPKALENHYEKRESRYASLQFTRNSKILEYNARLCLSTYKRKF